MKPRSAQAPMRVSITCSLREAWEKNFDGIHRAQRVEAVARRDDAVTVQGVAAHVLLRRFAVCAAVATAAEAAATESPHPPRAQRGRNFRLRRWPERRNDPREWV